jgi:WD40 repeat protein
MMEVTNVPAGGVSVNSYPAFAPDGRYLVAEDWGRQLRFYGVPSLDLITNLPGFAPAFSHDGKTFVYASGTRLLQRDSPAAPDAVDVEIGKLSSGIWSMALSPDGHTVACAAEEDNATSVQFWDVRRRRRLGMVTGHSDRICRLAFAPDGKRLASASFDGQVGIWDVARRQQIKLLSGHNGDLYGVAFSPDGQTVASCGEDSTIRLWSATTWEKVTTLRGKTRVSSVAFSPDGTVHIWRAPLWTELEPSAHHPTASPSRY